MSELWAVTRDFLERSEMSSVRNRAVRGRETKEAVNTKVRKGASGASQRVTGEMVSRLRAIRALWFAVLNDPRHGIEDLSVEFYYKVGELMEGKTLDGLTYHVISRDRVLSHAKEP